MKINLIILYFIKLCLFIKSPLAQNNTSNVIKQSKVFIPFKFLPDDDKKKYQENQTDNVYISAGGISDSFTTFYDQLSDFEKESYSKIYEISKKTPPEFQVSVDYDDTTEKLDYSTLEKKIESSSYNIITTIMYDYPELWWIGSFSYSIQDYNNNTYKITFKLKPSNSKFYNFSVDNFMNLNRKIDTIKIDVMKKINDLNLTTDYAKLRYIHDYLIVKNTYLLDESRKHIRNIYGSIVENICVCEGYAEAFQYLALQYNINCIIARSATHEWNLVEMNNVWYVVDVTWDDPGNALTGYGFNKDIETLYFLTGTNTLTDNSHTLVYSAFKNHNAFDYPVISETDYVASDAETSEVTTMRNSFTNSYLSTANGISFFLIYCP